jgi:hypothetical protein
MQLHKALLNSGHNPFFADSDDQDLSKPLEIDTSRDTDSENIDITSPGSPRLSADHKDNDALSPADNKQVTDKEPNASTSESPSKENNIPEYAVPKMAMPSTAWIPMPMVSGPWKDHPSAFRSALPAGHRSIWGALASGSSLTPSGPGQLRLPTPASR